MEGFGWGDGMAEGGAKVATVMEEEEVVGSPRRISDRHGGCLFNVLSWNPCGMKEDSIDNIVSQLQISRVRWDAVLVQEGTVAGEASLGTLQSGHVWYVAPCFDRPRSVAILVHHRWSHLKLDFICLSSRIAFVDFDGGDLSARLVTAHLPHGEYSDFEFESVLSEISVAQLQAKQQRRMFILGVDANAILGKQLVLDDPQLIGNSGMGSRNDRGHILADWMRKQKLSAANTCFSKKPEHLWTHRLWSTSSLRQIDFILVDVAYRINITNCTVLSDLMQASDHRALSATFRGCVRKVRRYTPPTPNIGWRPILDESKRPSLFHDSLLEKLDNGYPNSAAQLTDKIVEAASKGGSVEKKRKSEHSDYLKQLIQERKHCKDNSARMKLSKLIFLELRGETAKRQEQQLDNIIDNGRGRDCMQKALRQGHAKKRIPAARDAQGNLHSNGASICEVFASFYEKLYFHTIEQQNDPAHRSLQANISVTTEEVQRACKKLQRNRACSDDGLVAEMLQTQCEPLLLAISNMFTDILNGLEDPPESWREARLTVIFKKGDAPIKLPAHCCNTGSIQIVRYGCAWAYPYNTRQIAAHGTGRLQIFFLLQ